MTYQDQELTAIIPQLWALAQKLAEFADQETEQLDFETYLAFSEYETRLLAYGNLMATSDQVRFLQEELQAARQFLQETSNRLSRCPQ